MSYERAKHSTVRACSPVKPLGCWTGPRGIPIRDGRFHGIPRTKFSRYQNRQGHGILRYYLLMPYCNWNKYLQ